MNVFNSLTHCVEELKPLANNGMKHSQALVAGSVCCAAAVLFCGCSALSNAAVVSTPVYTANFAEAKGFEFGNYLQRTKHEIVSNETGVVVRFTGLGSKEKSKDTSWTVKTPRFAVTTNANFAVRIALKGDAPGRGGVRPGAALAWFDAADKAIVTTDALGHEIPLTTLVSVPTRREDRGLTVAISKGVVPDGARRARVQISVDTPDLFKDEVVDVCEIAYFERPADGEWSFGDTEAPEFEVLTATPCADVTVPLRVRFADASPIKEESVAFEVNGVATPLADWEKKGDVYTYAPKTPWKMNDVIRIKARASDVLGFEKTSWGFVAVTTNRVAHPRWSIRDDGMMLRDGTPFFPLGITNVHACPWNNENLDYGIGLMKSNGINCVHTYMVRNRPGDAKSKAHYHELVAACAKHDVMLYAEPATRTAGYGKPQLSPEAFAARDALLADNMIFARSASPAQAFWGVGDDTVYLLMPHELKRNHQFCKAVDPDVLTISADVTVPPPQHAAYVPYADVLMLECYPIHAEKPEPDEMAKLAKILDDGWEATRIAGCPNRSVMAMPQAFKGWGSWKRRPTEAEVRTEFFLALACRARGVVAYTSYSYKGNVGPFNDAVHQEQFLALTREVSALIPSLVTRDAVRQPAIEVTRGPKRDLKGGASVRSLLKEDGLLIAVNATVDEVAANIRLPSGKVISHTFAGGGVLVSRE